MPHFVCKHCGDDVPASPGYEMTAAARHAKDAGHPNLGLTRATSGPRQPVPGWVAHQRRGGGRWSALPVAVRGAVVTGLLLFAGVMGLWIADQAEEPPPSTGCKGGFPVRRC
jgi:hypothetical protein